MRHNPPSRDFLASQIRWACGRGIPLQDAEDIVFDAYHRATRTFSADRGAFESYMHTIVRNDCAYWWRRKAQTARGLVGGGAHLPRRGVRRWHPLCNRARLGRRPLRPTPRRPPGRRDRSGVLGDPADRDPGRQGSCPGRCSHRSARRSSWLRRRVRPRGGRTWSTTSSIWKALSTSSLIRSAFVRLLAMIFLCPLTLRENAKSIANCPSTFVGTPTRRSNR